MSEITNQYRTLTGRVYDLADLPPEERAFLDQVRCLYNGGTAWARLDAAWLSLGRATIWKNSEIPIGSAVYRICQDLVNRRGIEEGRVAQPDYRDQLADLIERHFRSRYEFCKQTGIDQAHLSRVLAGKRHLAPETFFKTLDALGIEIRLVHQSETTDARQDRAMIVGVLSDLQRDLDRLNELKARCQYTPKEEHTSLLGSPGFVRNVLDLLRDRVNRGEDLDQAIERESKRVNEESARLERELNGGSKEQEENGRRPKRGSA